MSILHLDFDLLYERDAIFDLRGYTDADLARDLDE